MLSVAAEIFAGSSPCRDPCKSLRAHSCRRMLARASLKVGKDSKDLRYQLAIRTVGACLVTDGLPPIHPGIFLRDDLDTLGLSAGEFAEHIRVPDIEVTKIIKGDLCGDDLLLEARQQPLRISQGKPGSAISRRSSGRLISITSVTWPPSPHARRRSRSGLTDKTVAHSCGASGSGMESMPSSWRTWANFFGSASRRSAIIVRSSASPASVKNNRGGRRPVSSRISPRSRSPLAIGDSFGLPASGPPRQVLR